MSGACFLARRSALEELGGFDESYFMFAEEMDLCWRAHQAGWGVGVQPAAVVTHPKGSPGGPIPTRCWSPTTARPCALPRDHRGGAGPLSRWPPPVLGIRLLVATVAWPSTWA